MSATDTEMLATWSEGMTIYQRIASIVAEMPAIGKGQKNTQQGFMYRGHDDVMNELNPLLSKYAVFFVPKVLERVPAQRTTGAGKVMYEVNLHVQYRFYGPGGDSFTATAWGEGTDSGDKSTNKAMTMALKNVLAQVFAVSTEEHSKYDTDANTDPETVAPALPFDPTKRLAPGAPEGWKEIQSLIMELDRELSEWVSEAIFKFYGKPAADLDDAEEKRECFCRVSNTVYKIAVECFQGGDFPPPTDAEYAQRFAWGFDGLVVDGPRSPFDDPQAVEDMQVALDHEGDPSDAIPADAGGQESATDAEPEQNPLATQTGAQGGSGHIGTGAPDE